jgi:hypothetical protein
MASAKKVCTGDQPLDWLEMDQHAGLALGQSESADARHQADTAMRPVPSAVV